MGGGAGWDMSNPDSKFSVPRTPKSSWRPHKDLFVLVEKCMALGKVKVQGGWGRRGGTRRTKGQECMHFVSTLVSTAWRMGFRLRVEGWLPPRDPVLKRGPAALTTLGNYAPWRRFRLPRTARLLTRPADTFLLRAVRHGPGPTERRSSVVAVLDQSVASHF